MNPRSPLRLLPAAALATMLTACVNLKPTADPTRYYVLSVAPEKEPLAEAASLLLPVCVVSVETPAYLDNPRLVLRKQDNELEYAEFHRWAEPVRDGLTRCLRDSLAAWLGAGRVHPLSRRWPSGEYLEVQASVSRLEVTQAGQAVLAVRWRIVQAKTGTVLHSQQTSITRAAPHVIKDPVGAVRALSEAVASWSRDVADALSGDSLGALRRR